MICPVRCVMALVQPASDAFVIPAVHVTVFDRAQSVAEIAPRVPAFGFLQLTWMSAGVIFMRQHGQSPRYSLVAALATIPLMPVLIARAGPIGMYTYPAARRDTTEALPPAAFAGDGTNGN